MRVFLFQAYWIAERNFNEMIDARSCENVMSPEHEGNAFDIVLKEANWKNEWKKPSLFFLVPVYMISAASLPLLKP